jgi:hypothetical protein
VFIFHSMNASFFFFHSTKENDMECLFWPARVTFTGVPITISSMSFRFVWGHVLKMPWTFHQAGHTQSISSRIKLGIYCPPFQAVPFLSLSLSLGCTNRSRSNIWTFIDEKEASAESKGVLAKHTRLINTAIMCVYDRVWNLFFHSNEISELFYIYVD